MEAPQDRHVVVPAEALADLCELASRAAEYLERASHTDPLASALRGSLAQVSTGSVLEPKWAE